MSIDANTAAEGDYQREMSRQEDAPVGEWLLCAACGSRMETGKIERIEMPLYPGNPYPSPLLVHATPECFKRGEEIAEERYRDLRQDPEFQQWLMEEEGY